jgi:hypothetical protein
MTLYLSFRSQDVGGAVAGPRLLDGDGTAIPLALRLVGEAEIASRVAGRNLLIAVHGFNVSGEYGARSLGKLEPRLGLSALDLFIGVLWPGDFWLPVVNYPFTRSRAPYRWIAAAGWRIIAAAGSGRHKASPSSRTVSARASCSRRSRISIGRRASSA